MIVVSDNGPIGFLVQINRIEYLRDLFHRVIMPTAVHIELLHPATPELIRDWIVSLPKWVEVKSPVKGLNLNLSGRGEREAIQLCRELGASLLCDDRQGVSHAKREGLRVTGTLGILQEAHARGWCDISEAIDDLRTRTDFHLPEQLIPKIVTQAREMRRNRESAV